MNKRTIGFLLSLAMMLGLASCGEKEVNSKLILNEVLIENQSNFQDDYGVHGAWIEVFNKSYTSADLAGYLLKMSNQPGDTATYIIPKGDVLTLVKPRQHALFWADGQPSRGTFHTNFVMDGTTATWIGLYDSGKKLVNEVTIPANILQADQSYARISDASEEWEVKGAEANKYVTPSTNNQTLEGNAKMEKFQSHDSAGCQISVTCVTIALCRLQRRYLGV